MQGESSWRWGSATEVLTVRATGRILVLFQVRKEVR